jgi:hypothetical protein
MSILVTFETLVPYRVSSAVETYNAVAGESAVNLSVTESG